MTADTIDHGMQHIDVHLDLPPETVEEIRNGKKTVSLIDCKTKDRVQLTQCVPGMVTWKQVLLAGSVIAAIAGNSIMIGSKMNEFETATDTIAELQRNVTTALNVAGQHGQEFASLRADMSTLMALYDRIDNNIDVKTQDRYTGNDSQRDWASHDKIHEQEDRMLQSQLAEIYRSLQRLEKHMQTQAGL